MLAHEASGEQRHRQPRPDQVSDLRQDHSGQQLDYVRLGAGDRRQPQLDCQLAEAEDALDGRNTFGLDRANRLGLRADDRVRAAAAEPADSRDVRGDAVDQVEVNRGQLPRGVDLAQDGRDLEAVAAQDEDDAGAPSERRLELLVRLDRGTAGEIEQPPDDLGRPLL